MSEHTSAQLWADKNDESKDAGKDGIVMSYTSRTASSPATSVTQTKPAQPCAAHPSD